MTDAFTIAAGRFWAIEPDALRSLLQIAAREGDLSALATRSGRPMNDAAAVDLRGDVAIIPVRGPIFRYAGLFTEVCGATATATLARDFQAALDNPAVRTIALDIDSPGGEVTGIHEFVNQVYAARSRKTIKAYVGGMGASAAYWIASAASQIVVDDIATLGSIGVVSTYTDTRQRDEKAGLRRVEIVSSASPDKRLDPATEKGRASIQAVVDRLADVFIGDVARNRGVSRERVINGFGKGGLLVGADAVRAGMANGLGSLEGLIRGEAPSVPPSQRADAPARRTATANPARTLQAIFDDRAAVSRGKAVPSSDGAIRKLGGSGRDEPAAKAGSSTWDSTAEKFGGTHADTPAAMKRMRTPEEIYAARAEAMRKPRA